MKKEDFIRATPMRYLLSDEPAGAGKIDVEMYSEKAQREALADWEKLVLGSIENYPVYVKIGNVSTFEPYAQVERYCPEQIKYFFITFSKPLVKFSIYNGGIKEKYITTEEEFFK